MPRTDQRTLNESDLCPFHYCDLNVGAYGKYCIECWNEESGGDSAKFQSNKTEQVHDRGDFISGRKDETIHPIDWDS